MSGLGAGLLPLAIAQATLGAINVTDDSPLTTPSGRPVWSDEFDGTHLDPARWRYETERNRGGWYNNERQYYAAGRRENLRVERGRLVIEARREAMRDRADWGGQPYSSARISSRTSWTYGFYEIRARIPCARGTWPAIWMLPDAGTWPDGGEIDVMEHVGWNPHQVHATLHTALYNHARGTQRGSAVTVPTARTAFHRYQLDWRPDAIRIGVDGRSYLHVANDRPGGRGAWPFDTPFHLILNLAVGGDWGGAKGIDEAALPQRMEVDYVRVWPLRDDRAP